MNCLFGIQHHFSVWCFQYAHSQEVEHYIMTIQKASGEPSEESSYVIKAQTVTLVLCYSAYKLSITALNKAGPSPAAHLDINAMEDPCGRSSQELYSW